jgi:hypothetical protein
VRAGLFAAGGKIDNEAPEREQHAAHGLAFLHLCSAIRELPTMRGTSEGAGEMEALLAEIRRRISRAIAGGVVMTERDRAPARAASRTLSAISHRRSHRAD